LICHAVLIVLAVPSVLTSTMDKNVVLSYENLMFLVVLIASFSNDSLGNAVPLTTLQLICIGISLMMHHLHFHFLNSFRLVQLSWVHARVLRE